jgi:hypothetical protein
MVENLNGEKNCFVGQLQKFLYNVHRFYHVRANEGREKPVLKGHEIDAFEVFVVDFFDVEGV